MFGIGKHKSQADKDAQKLANELADNTPPSEQAGLYPEKPGLGPFGAIPSGAGGAFVDRKDKA